MRRKKEGAPSSPFDRKGPAAQPGRRLGRSKRRDDPIALPDVWPQSVSQILRKTFPTRRFGYDATAVRACLEDVAQSVGVLGGRRSNPQGSWDPPTITSDGVRGVVFRSARHGLDMRSVDVYLDGIAVQLEGLERLIPS